MKLLLTGDAGLIGRELKTALVAAGHEVRGFDIGTDPAQDLRDPGAVAAALAGVEGVLHLAAISRVAWGEDDPALCHAVNVTGTAHLLDAVTALGAAAPWVVFASSREVYGDPDVSPIPETTPRAPLNHYGRSKAEGEELVEAFVARGGRAGMVRLSNVYGTVHDHPDRAVPSLLWRALQGETLKITGEANFFDFVHVEDCVRGLMAMADRLAAGEAAPPTVHLATGIPTSLGALAKAAIATAGSGSGIEVLPARSFDVKGFCGTPERAAKVLGWRAEIALDEGLARLARAMVSAGAPKPVTMPR
ncbi:NAD-dependent epimerase/dehydratase family protein [Frigidibacter sp. MR17.14]|uniref:NAD-dependent epimerase/dehydratase family protein n=1 Tax=Frigidibacter sp. MR17.14 TaxID=3126509 RepID=UPI0030130C6B